MWISAPVTLLFAAEARDVTRRGAAVSGGQVAGGGGGCDLAEDWLGDVLAVAFGGDEAGHDDVGQDAGLAGAAGQVSPAGGPLPLRCDNFPPVTVVAKALYRTKSRSNGGESSQRRGSRRNAGEVVATQGKSSQRRGSRRNAGEVTARTPSLPERPFRADATTRRPTATATAETPDKAEREN